MKITNEMIEHILKPLGQLANMDLPVIPALKIAKNIKSIEEHSKPYFKIKNDLYKKYGERVKEGNQEAYKLKEENVDKFNIDLKELLNQENEIKIEKIIITENFPNVKPIVLTVLDFMFEVGGKNVV